MSAADIETDHKQDAALQQVLYELKNAKNTLDIVDQEKEKEKEKSAGANAATPSPEAFADQHNKRVDDMAQRIKLIQLIALAENMVKENEEKRFKEVRRQRELEQKALSEENANAIDAFIQSGELMIKMSSAAHLSTAPLFSNAPLEQRVKQQRHARWLQHEKFAHGLSLGMSTIPIILEKMCHAHGLEGSRLTRLTGMLSKFQNLADELAQDCRQQLLVA